MRPSVIASSIAISLALCAPAAAQEFAKPWESLRALVPLPPVEKTGRQDVGDVELYYAVYGRGEPVILLHPGLGNGDYWANQVGPLSQEYQVIVVDLRGHGRSSASAKPLTYRLMADDILRLIKAQKLKEPTIVGWGDGATIGLELALRYPKRVGRLVLFGLTFDQSGFQPRPDTSDTFIEYVHKAQADHARLSGGQAGFTSTLDQMEALWEREPNFSHADLQRLKTPTILMSADHDEWVKPDHMTQAAQLIPGAQMITLPRTSHFAPWQAPKKFDDALLVALRR